jgi:uroporphyrin-III C-methyltransferase
MAKKKDNKSKATSADDKTDLAEQELAKLEAELAQKTQGDSTEKSESESASQEDKKPESAPEINFELIIGKEQPSEKNETAQAAEPDAASSQTAEPEPEPILQPEMPIDSVQEKPKKTRTFSWWGFIAFWISLAAAAGVGYLWWIAQQWQVTLGNQQQQTTEYASQTFKQANQAMSQVQQHLSQLQLNQQRNNDFVLTTQQNMDSLTKRMNQLGQSQPNSWLAAEALYLVNLAEHRLVVERDSNTAIQLLLSANLRLNAMNDPSVFYLRKAISEDIALLNAITTPESDAIFLTLSGLIAQVQSWKFAHKYIPDPKEHVQASAVSNDADDWRTNLTNSLDRVMSNFITVERRDTKVEPELPPNERWYVRANITAQLIAAQHASLRYQPDVYVSSLTQIELWLKQYFDSKEPEVVAAINTIGVIKKKPVSLNLPSQLGSQALLANYVQSQQNLKTLNQGDGESQ